jgi:hypothetical protein
MASELPRIVKFAYDEYVLNEKESTKCSVKCKFCTDKRTIISEKCGTISNFVKHIKAVHLRGKVTLHINNMIFRPLCCQVNPNILTTHIFF